jgi:acetyltransferase-like isoleucine patch superfamily enzyme
MTFSWIQQKFNGMLKIIRTKYATRHFNSWGSGVVGKGFESNGNSQISCGNDVCLKEHIWISFVDGNGKLTIEDGVYIGRFCTMAIAGHIIIRKNALISDRAYFGDCNHGFDSRAIPICRQPITFAGAIEIGEGCWIGIGVSILPGVKIGKNAVIGANSVVTRDVPDYCVAAGNPARVIREMAIPLL